MAPSTSNAPALTRSAKKAMLNAKQTKAFEQLDKMMEEILEHDIPGMCTFKFGPPIRAPTTSRSDGHICAAATNDRLAFSISLDQNQNLSLQPLQNRNHAARPTQTLSSSQSFGQETYQCRCGATILGNAQNQNSSHSHNGRHRMHSNACNLL